MPPSPRPTAWFLPIPRLPRWALFLGLWFLSILTLLRVAAHLSFGTGDAPVGRTAAAFWLGLRFDLRVVCYALLALLVLGAFRGFDPFRSGRARRGWLAAYAGFAVALAVFYGADFIHYGYLGQRLNASALGYLKDARESALMAWQTYPVGWITLGLGAGVALVAAGVRALHRHAAAAPVVELRRAGRIAWTVVPILACLVGIFGRLGQYPLRWSDAFDLRDDASAHLALNPFQSFFSSLSFRTPPPDLQKVQEHYPLLRDYLGLTSETQNPELKTQNPKLKTQNPKPKTEIPTAVTFERRVAAPSPAAPGRPPNVVLVLCESFSAYKSSMWGNPLDPTPFFASLCRDGVFFDNCFTPHIGTARGVWATVTGIPDVEPVKTASRNPALVDQHTIIDDFTGYERFYFIGGSSSWANIRGLLTNNIAGLQLYEEGSYRSPRIDVWGISDKNLLLEANDVLSTRQTPFFALIQTADNHRPYTIPREDLGEFVPVEVSASDLQRSGFESNAELNGFRYSDFALRKFMEAARQSPYFADTIFVFIGDHGIAGRAGAPFPPAWTEQGLTAYHVPLLFYAPGRLRPERIHSVASMVDVLPTVAGLAGIPYRNTGLGRDLIRQQAVDGGRSNAAFVVDHHSRTIGVVQGSYYAAFHRESGREDFVWADFAAPPPPAPAADAEVRAGYRRFAEALHETARFLLLHNPKAPGRSPSAVAAVTPGPSPLPGAAPLPHAHRAPSR